MDWLILALAVAGIVFILWDCKRRSRNPKENS